MQAWGQGKRRKNLLPTLGLLRLDLPVASNECGGISVLASHMWVVIQFIYLRLELTTKAPL